MRSEFSSSRPLTALLLLVAALPLTGCGGSDMGAADTDIAPAIPEAVTTGTLHFGVLTPAELSTVTSLELHPTYHLSPVLPEVPQAADAGEITSASVVPPPARHLPEAVLRMPTRGLVPDQLLRLSSSDVEEAATSSAVSVTYSPAQIRAAYGLPALPSSYANLSAAQLAQYGAGQTIYLVDAYDDPMAYGELLAFSQLFGLPGCNNPTLASSASLPLKAPSANSCDFYKVYGTPTAAMTSTAPAYNAQWAVEVALDVQWAHAIAPLARLVLVEAPDANMTSMTGAIGLANKMGQGLVSMSFAGAEGSYVLGADSFFQTSGMSYFAATGDSGEAVNWPAVSPYVVGVGGTTLSVSAAGVRSEQAWSLTGGGVSAYEPAPAYQNSKVPGMQSYGKRAVSDVAFNADPATGQFVAVIPNQTTCSFCQVSWVSAGGTSLATPQWAGIGAIAKALRIQAGKAVLGDPHVALYTQIAATAGTYAADFADVAKGNDGSCSVCSAKTGYDIPTGLGSPNGAALINTLTGLVMASAPVVRGGISVSAIAGHPLTFNVSVTDSNPYVMSLQNAPAGMTVSGSAVVSWSNPVVGSYNVNVVATDAKTGLSGMGVYSIFVAGNTPPAVSSGAADGVVGKSLGFPVTVTDVNPCNLSLSGAPSGMSISSSGLVTWASPVAGTYNVTVVAKDMMNGLSGQGVYAVIINKTAGPTVSSGNISGPAGSPLSYAVQVNTTDPCAFTLVGAPNGMSISSSGTVSWASPVAGNYTVSVIAKDTKTGLSGSGTIDVIIATVGGPAISGSGLSGKPGTPLSGTITISDSGSSIVGTGIGGMPVGMNVQASGGVSKYTVSWNSPVAGIYLLQVSATDAAGHRAGANLLVTISN